MKDKNGIEIDCSNCEAFEYCKDSSAYEQCKNKAFSPSKEAYEARIAELQNELYVVQESERAEAQEADRLRGEVKGLGKKLTEIIKLFGERSRECGELEAHNEVLQRRVQEFSMGLLDRTMKENKDVLERLKNWEEYLDKDMPTQSTDAADVSKNGEKSTESEGEDEPFAENIASWIEENQNQDLSQFLANLDICCYSTKYNEDIICIQPNGENGWNFEIAQLFSNLNRTLAQYNRTKGFTRGFLERVELLFKLHKGQTNEQLKDVLKTKNEKH